MIEYTINYRGAPYGDDEIGHEVARFETLRLVRAYLDGVGELRCRDLTVRAATSKGTRGLSPHEEQMIHDAEYAALYERDHDPRR